MKMQWCLGLALAIAPFAQAARTAVPGTVNYIEGQVSIDGNAISTQQDGSAALRQDQLLSVGSGKAEILLSPGTFIRVGNNSQVRMIAPELADPRVEVVRGEAMVEVDYKPKLARLDVLERGSDASLLKEGLYKFDADEGRIQVIDGKAQVSENGQSKEIGKGKQITLTGGPLQVASFDRKAEDDLYRWSDVRASYLAEANEASARTVYVNGGWGAGWGPGWFWNPYFATFSWLPGDGYFWSPFGYPFFSPTYVVYAPVVRPRYYPAGAVRTAGGAVIAPRGIAGRAVTVPRAGAVPSSSFRAAPAAPRMSMAAPRMSMAPRFGGMHR
jgi:hypothetical protein